MSSGPGSRLRPRRRAASRTPRVVLVVGASSGIGRATVHRLAAAGDHLVLAARSRGPLEETAAQCRDAGAGSVHVAPGDVGEQSVADSLVAGVLARHGRLDALVQCAGVAAYGRLEDVPAEVFDRVLRTNVLGTANLARAVVPVLRRQGHGTVVVVGSVLGQIAAPSMSAYVVSKWALRSLARELQLENRDSPGVHVTLVVPGGVDTPIYQAAATYLGRTGRPPPPVDSPHKVARRVVAALDRPRRRISVGVANPVMTAGFVLAPSVYDALVGPLFARLALDRRSHEAGPGNVLAPLPGGHGLRGRGGSGPLALVRAVGNAVLPRRHPPSR